MNLNQLTTNFIVTSVRQEKFPELIAQTEFPTFSHKKSPCYLFIIEPNKNDEIDNYGSNSSIGNGDDNHNCGYADDINDENNDEDENDDENDNGENYDKDNSTIMYKLVQYSYIVYMPIYFL